MSEWIALTPLLCVLGGGLIVMIVDAFTDEPAGLDGLTAVILAIASGSSVVLWMRGVSYGPDELTRYLTVDSFALFFDIVICVSAALSALMAGAYLREHKLERGEFYPLFLFTVFGAMILARANELLTLFIGLEMMSLGLYALIAFRRTSPRSAEAGLKYFLLGSFATAILLFGSALLYGATGKTELSEVGAAIAGGSVDLRLTTLALFMILIGFAFKISAAPFHMWTPDAYEGAITPVTSFMAVTVKAAMFAIMLRVLTITFGDDLSANLITGWPKAVAILAAVTMIWGNLAAIWQSSVKRMLAYSSIAHAGYMLIGIVAAQKLGTSVYSTVLFYLITYAVSNALAFGSLIYLGSKGKEAVSYADLVGVGRNHPWIAFAFSWGVLSLMGFPPTAGFFAKYYIFSAAVEGGSSLLWLAIVGAITSAIGAYYYLRVIVSMYMNKPQPNEVTAVPMRSWGVAFVVILTSVLILGVGIAPGSVLNLAQTVAGDLEKTP